MHNANIIIKMHKLVGGQSFTLTYVTVLPLMRCTVKKAVDDEIMQQIKSSLVTQSLSQSVGRRC